MKNLIAIVGMAGSGKSLATTYLEQKGYHKIYFGGLIYDKMKEANIPITPESQKEFREKLRKEHGMGCVAKLLLPQIEQAYQEGNTVLDGLYSWEEYHLLQQKFGDKLILVAIICDKNLRYQRIKERVNRPFSKEEITSRDITEIENIEKGGPIAYADYYLYNNDSIEEYYERLEEIIEKINKQEGEK